MLQVSYSISFPFSFGKQNWKHIPQYENSLLAPSQAQEQLFQLTLASETCCHCPSSCVSINCGISRTKFAKRAAASMNPTQCQLTPTHTHRQIRACLRLSINVCESSRCLMPEINMKCRRLSLRPRLQLAFSWQSSQNFFPCNIFIMKYSIWLSDTSTCLPAYLADGCLAATPICRSFEHILLGSDNFDNALYNW